MRAFRTIKCFTTFKKPRVLFTQRSQTIENQEQDDDIHSMRLAKALNTEEETSDYKVNYKFNFHQNVAFKQLPLSDMNIVYYNNDDTLNKSSRLEHGLEAIVRKPGIYSVQEMAQLMKDPLDADFLKKVYPQEQLKLDRFDIYVPPSRDMQLQSIALKEGLKFVMSTSTISNFLMQVYYALSGFRNPFFEQVFQDFDQEPKKFMISQRKPISNYIHRTMQPNGKYLYSVDGDSGIFRMSEILMNVGKIVERQLTIKRQEFEERFASENEPTHLPPLEDHHRYMKLNNEIMLRSQIDCYSYDEKGKPFVFEIKSRAACPIRYDFSNCLEYLDYEIISHKGLMQSYEREFYDLIRGAFLKWSIQMRIGRMSGAFIAYHNIREVQGFEYVTAQQIDNRVYGSTHFAESIFVVSSRLITTLLNEIFDQHLVNEQWESIKTGVYAHASFRKLVIFTELFKNREDVKKYTMVEPTEGLNNEYDYYTKLHKLENKVFKFDVLLKVYVNGIEQVGNTIPFRKGDQLNVKYLVRPMGEASFGDYMNFLHDCYKFDEINVELAYAGAWIKNNQA